MTVARIFEEIGDHEGPNGSFDKLRMTVLLKVQQRAPFHGFSLLEMLLVLAVLAGMAALAMEGYSATVQSAAITTGANMASDVLTEGRADAVAQNTTVEVRIYDLAPQPGAAPVYSAMQLHWLKGDGTTPPAAKVTLLPAWIVIDATPAHSPLIASNTQTATPDASDPRLNSQTRVFHFLPDGSTDLNPAINWFMTLRAATQSDPARFPTNWASITVDAATGRPQIYRP
jgi:uncharacterized protein (TIGR02596 family)